MDTSQSLLTPPFPLLFKEETAFHLHGKSRQLGESLYVPAPWAENKRTRPSEVFSDSLPPPALPFPSSKGGAATVLGGILTRPSSDSFFGEDAKDVYRPSFLFCTAPEQPTPPNLDELAASLSAPYRKMLPPVLIRQALASSHSVQPSTPGSPVNPRPP